MQAGERVGIGEFYLDLFDKVYLYWIMLVGRTGSGKVSVDSDSPIHNSNIAQSSLTLSLLRAIITEGKVYYDGIPTDTINLDVLRSNITIIPQVVCPFPNPFRERKG